MRSFPSSGVPRWKGGLALCCATAGEAGRPSGRLAAVQLTGLALQWDLGGSLGAHLRRRAAMLSPAPRRRP